MYKSNVFQKLTEKDSAYAVRSFAKSSKHFHQEVIDNVERLYGQSSQLFHFFTVESTHILSLDNHLLCLFDTMRQTLHKTYMREGQARSLRLKTALVDAISETDTGHTSAIEIESTRSNKTNAETRYLGDFPIRFSTTYEFALRFLQNRRVEKALDLAVILHDDIKSTYGEHHPLHLFYHLIRAAVFKEQKQSDKISLEYERARHYSSMLDEENLTLDARVTIKFLQHYKQCKKSYSPEDICSTYIERLSAALDSSGPNKCEAQDLRKSKAIFQFTIGEWFDKSGTMETALLNYRDAYAAFVSDDNLRQSIMCASRIRKLYKRLHNYSQVLWWCKKSIDYYHGKYFGEVSDYNMPVYFIAEAAQDNPSLDEDAHVLIHLTFQQKAPVLKHREWVCCINSLEEAYLRKHMHIAYGIINKWLKFQQN